MASWFSGVASPAAAQVAGSRALGEPATRSPSSTTHSKGAGGGTECVAGSFFHTIPSGGSGISIRSKSWAAGVAQQSFKWQSSPASLSHLLRSCDAVRNSRTLWPSPRALYVDDDDDNYSAGSSYLVDAPESDGDGFSFSGGKYSKELGPYDEWIARGNRVSAYPVEGDVKKSRDPVFGLAMGEESQIKGNSLEWFYVEEGDIGKPPLLLLHGVPSQAYSFRKVISLLSPYYRVIAPDWIGFGFSEKPQPGYGFKYSLPEYTAALGHLIDALRLNKISIVVQGLFGPSVVKYAADHPERVDALVLMNAPVLPEHAILPRSLDQFTGFLMGEIFAQDPIRASDGVLNDCGPYLLDEADSMVYRRPYLMSGMAGFALTAVARSLKRELKGSVDELQRVFKSGGTGNCRLALLWGLKDRWLKSDGVCEFAESVGVRYAALDQVGHHAQEDYGEEVASTLLRVLRSA